MLAKPHAEPYSYCINGDAAGSSCWRTSRKKIYIRKKLHGNIDVVLLQADVMNNVHIL